MTRRILRILAFPAAFICIPYSIIGWIMFGGKQITIKLLDFSLTNENII